MIKNPSTFQSNQLRLSWIIKALKRASTWILGMESRRILFKLDYPRPENEKIVYLIKLFKFQS